MARPNILLITADQHRWDCWGYAGNADVRTPNLDALARRGIVFRQAVCQLPVCGPSRATMLTGQYPDRHGVWANGQGVPPDTPALPGVLRAAGYYTGAVGKMEFTPPRTNYGFDVMALAEQGPEGRRVDDYHAWLAEQGLSDDTEEWDQVRRDEAPPEYWRTLGAMSSVLPESAHSTTWIGDRAVRFLQRAREPFFLWVSFIKPHHPFDPPAPWASRYAPGELTLPQGYVPAAPEADRPAEGHFDLRRMDEAAFRRVLVHYYGAISHVDHQIGRLMATLAGRGFTNNFILYTSDHGDAMGQHGLILKDGPIPYDSLLRVPVIATGFAGQRRGVVDDALVELTDLAPTIWDVAGVTPPDTAQGVSLLPRMRDETASMRGAAYARHRDGRRVARDSWYKLIEAEAGAERVFFDLRRDPQEWTNVAGQPRVVREQARLARALQRNRG